MNENIHRELITLQNELAKLKTAAEQIEMAKKASTKALDSAENVIKITVKIATDYQKLADKTNELVEKIELINFPDRLDKIETNIEEINSAIRGIPYRIDNIEENIRDSIVPKIENIGTQLEDNISLLQNFIREKVSILLDNYRGKSNWIIYLICILIALIVGSFIYNQVL